MYLHVTIMDEQEEDVLFTTRKDQGGFGEPCLYILGKGNSRPLRGIEIALHSMTRGERNIILMRSEMCLMHPEVENSTMANHMKSYDGLVDAHSSYKVDVELVDWKSPHIDSLPCNNKDHVFKYVLEEGEGWETPREPFSISVRISGRSVSHEDDTAGSLRESSITCEVGDGTLPSELELGICTMRKSERAIVLIPIISAHPMIPSQKDGVKDDAVRPMQSKYMQYEVVLDDLIQVRDLMGDGKSIKRITRKGEGEFPIDCPMEDTSVAIKTKIRKKGDSTWLPFLSRAIGETITISTGVGELPELLDAALRVMLKDEVSMLSTIVDEKLSAFFSQELASTLANGQSVEIEIELVSFQSALPIAALPPDEKLLRAKQMKMEGNDLFKMGKISLAKNKYNKALVCVGKAYEFSEDDAQTATEIKVSCMLNMAACAQKDRAYGEAISWCEKVLGYVYCLYLLLLLLLTY